MENAENFPQVPEDPTGQAAPSAQIKPDERGPDGKFLPGNQAAADHYFKPGMSGNPNGRPSTKKFTDKMRLALDKNDGEMLKAMVNVACQRALKGDFRYFKEIVDRMDGKLTDRIAIETEEHLCELTEQEQREARRLAEILVLLPPDWSSDSPKGMQQLQSMLNPSSNPR